MQGVADPIPSDAVARGLCPMPRQRTLWKGFFGISETLVRELLKMLMLTESWHLFRLQITSARRPAGMR